MSTHLPLRGTPARPPRSHRQRSRLRADMPLLGGVRPPLAALLCTLLAVVALTALALGRTTTQDVAPAVLTSQQHIAEDSAADLRASIDEDVATLRHAADILAAEPAQDGASALRRLGTLGHSWRGAALVDPSGDKLLAVTGEALPLSAVSGVKADDEIHPKLVTLASGQVRLLAFATVDLPGTGKRLLVASDTLAPTVPSGTVARTLMLVDHKGQVLVTAAMAAVPAPAPAPAAKPTAAAGAAPGATTVNEADSKLPGQIARTAGAARAADPDRKSSGSVLGSVHDGRRTVVGWSVLATSETSESAHALGLTLVTTLSTQQSRDVTGDSLFALFAAGSLLLAALLVTLILTLGLQRPLLRLHVGGVRLARGDLTRPVRVPLVGETARIGAALESLRRQLTGQSDVFQPRRRRFGSRALVLCCALLLASWSVPLLLVLNRPVASAVVPKQLVDDQQVRTSAIAEQVRQTLDSGYLDLAGVASALTPATTSSQAHTLLATAAEQHSRYRTLYVLSKDGSVLAEVGDKPRRPDRPIPAGSGLLQVNTSGRLPVVAAYAAVPTASPAAAPAPGAKAGAAKTATPPAQTGASPVTVVAEFDITFLDAGLDHAGIGQVWLVDERQRVIASSDGFRAFQQLPDTSLTRLATTATTSTSTGQRSAAVLRASGDSAIAAAAPLGVSAAPVAPRVGGTVAAPSAAPVAPTTPAANSTGRTLGWQVVSAQPTSWLNLGGYRTQRLTMLAGLLGLAAATGCLGWLFVVVVRPLRDLAGLAERLAAGDRRTVLYPVHHDEIGSVTRSLELVRQQLTSSSRSSSNTPSTRV